MKKQILIFSFITLCLALQAQVKPYVINSLGGSAQYTGGYLAYSVGEPVIGTAVGTNTTLTQGFLQTWQVIIRQIALKLFIEGLYSGGGMMHEAIDYNAINDDYTEKWGIGVADTVTVMLYDNTYANIVAKYPGVNLHTNGYLTIPGIPISLNNSYYITIFQRNSVPITTAAPRPFAGSTISYDFSTPIDQAYGAGLAPQKDLLDGYYGMYTGTLDHDPDFVIDGSDLGILEVDVNSGPSGYLETDLNGDGVVDGSDLIIMEPNVNFGPLFFNPLNANKKHTSKILNK